MNVALGIVYGFLGVCAFFLGVSREGSCWVLWKLVTGLRSHRTAFHSSRPATALPGTCGGSSACVFTCLSSCVGGVLTAYESFSLRTSDTESIPELGHVRVIF